MNLLGPFRAEISGTPYMRIHKDPHGVRFTVCDTADDTTIGALPFWCDAHLSARLERAVEAFYRAMMTHEIKEAAE